MQARDKIAGSFFAIRPVCGLSGFWAERTLSRHSAYDPIADTERRRLAITFLISLPLEPDGA